MKMDYFEYTLPNGITSQVHVNTDQLQKIPIQLTFYLDNSVIVRRTILLNVWVTGIRYRNDTYIQIEHRNRYYELIWNGPDPDGHYRGFDPIYEELFTATPVKNPIPHWTRCKRCIGNRINDFNLDLIALGTPYLYNSSSVVEHLYEINTNLIEGFGFIDQYYEIINVSDKFMIQSHSFDESISNFPTWDELN